MKIKYYKLFLILFWASYSLGQDITPFGAAVNPYEFEATSFCVTAKKVCSSESISKSYSLKKDCENELKPKFFRFLFDAPGQLQLNTGAHSGNYTFYGPFSNYGLDACEKVTLNVNPKYSGSLAGLQFLNHLTGYYILKVETNCMSLPSGFGIEIEVSSPNLVCRENLDCKDCISSFSPQPGRYIISAWVKGEAANKNTSYLNPGISVAFDGAPDSSYFTGSGQIIDDWQRIDGIIEIPTAATAINIRLHCKTGNCTFDDIRFHPIDASMISYVYDPINLRLVAQLDERNYATFYDYDEEGQLIRVKKETEKGIMTIQENRNNTNKQ